MSSGAESLNPGELRRYVTIQRQQYSQDETGGWQESWVDVIHAWAKIDPKTGRELYAAAQTFPELNTEITIRWRPELDESMRIVDEYGATYDIKYLSDVELRHQLYMIGATRVPPGRKAGRAAG